MVKPDVLAPLMCLIPKCPNKIHTTLSSVFCDEHYFKYQASGGKAVVEKIIEHQGEAIEIGAKGGAGSKIPRWELMDFRALDAVAQVFTEGANKYAVDNWRAVPVVEHIRHAIRHLYMALEPDQQYGEYTGYGTNVTSELAHAACRAIMAVAVHHQESGVATVVPKGLACNQKEE